MPRLVQCRGVILRLLRVALLTAVVGFVTSAARAQDPPPRIGPFVLDVHGTVPRFPSDDQQLADSRALLLRELPGAGLGLHTSAYLYPLRWKAVTFGIGGDLTLARSSKAAPQIAQGVVGRAVTETFSHIAPEISFNFGDGDGWSYISGGIGPGVWSLVPEGSVDSPADTERLQTINYGGGARWFIKPHLAFSFDVRFYAINPGTPVLGRPGGPRKTLVFMGAGISVK